MLPPIILPSQLFVSLNRNIHIFYTCIITGPRSRYKEISETAPQSRRY